MITKEQLRGYQKIRRELRQIRERIEELETAMTAPKSQVLSGMPGGSAPDGNPVDKMIDRKNELLATYYAKMAALAEEQLKIEKAIEALPRAERLLIRYHYFDGLRWEAVGVKICYSLRQVHNLHSSALRRLREQEQEG